MKRILAIVLILVTVTALIPLVAIPLLAAPPAFVTANSYVQLKAYVEDATTTHIQLASNIKLDKKTVTINTAKPELVIDGAGTYTLSASDSATLAYSMRYIKKGYLKNITIQNMKIDGENHYGIIAIDDNTAYSDVTVTFDNIRYTGPGLSWGPKSNFVIRNSNIKVVPSLRIEAHEIFVCLRTRLEGNVDIVKEAPKSTTELFRVTGGKGGVTIGANAVVNVVSNQNATKAGSTGFVYYGCPELHLIFEEDCLFNYEGNNLFQQCSAVDYLNIGERAEVNIALYGKLYCSYGIFAVRGTSNIEKDSVVRLYSFNNTEPQPLFQLKGTGTINFNSPREVFIYNSSTKSGNTGLAMGPWGCDVNINFNNISSIEYWKLNTASRFSLPAATYQWVNPDGSLFSAAERISGAVVKSATTTGYSGKMPWTTTTAAVKDVNVVRINGSFAPDEAKVVVVCKDSATGTILDTAEYTMPRGTYGPYAPVYDGSPRYSLIGWDDTSAPVSGIIKAGETKTIVFLYESARADLEVNIDWIDFSNVSGARPSAILVALLRNGALYQTQMPATNSGDQQTLVFANAELYDATGTPYTYTIMPYPVARYDLTIDGLDITYEIQR